MSANKLAYGDKAIKFVSRTLKSAFSLYLAEKCVCV